MATIAPPDVQEWIRIRDQIKNLELLNLPVVKAREEQRKSQAERELQAAQAAAQQAAAKAKKEAKDVGKLEHRGVSRFMARVGGDLDEKVAKEKREAEEASVALEARKKAVAAKDAELKAITAGLARVSMDEAGLKGLKEQQKALLKRVFDGPSGAGDKYEKDLQSEVAILKPDYTKYHKKHDDYEKGHDHVKKGVALCGRSVQAMQAAQKLCGADMMMNIGPRNGGLMGNMADIKKRQTLREASQAIQAAAGEVLRAKEYIPEIQPIDPALIKAMGPAMDILFDGIMVDMIIAKQVKESLERVTRTYQHLQQGLQWVEGVKKDVDSKYNGVKGTYKTKKAALKEHRRRLIAQAASPQASAPSAPPVAAPAVANLISLDTPTQPPFPAGAPGMAYPPAQPYGAPRPSAYPPSMPLPQQYAAPPPGTAYPPTVSAPQQYAPPPAQYDPFSPYPPQQYAATNPFAGAAPPSPNPTGYPQAPPSPIPNYPGTSASGYPMPPSTH
eukprot:comp23859_c1_seq1/m.41746 comp23859_c1_seq1/g.41746  ORF comp23859_c1_seq1/g.41746 comp23859_c1_seq1/m.41746 type:complete len:501 (-) comp23859_c1_seq1:681-2183(-)